MKRILLALFISGLFTGVYAQDKALLYELSGKDLLQPSYLYGTFHLVCPDDLVVTDAMRKALAQSKRLYLELDFDDPQLPASMMTSAILTGGKTVKDFLSPADYATLDGYMQKNLGAGLEALGVLKPIALMAMMYVKVLNCQPGSYDTTLAQLAGSGGKEILGLETLEEQMAALDRIPMEQQLKGLVDMARNPGEAQKELAAILDAYKAQDLDLLMSLIRTSNFDGDIQALEDELLVKRNTNWIPIIEKAAREKPIFFAFGAGHLGGKSGVINLLRQKGYVVKPVR